MGCHHTSRSMDVGRDDCESINGYPLHRMVRARSLPSALDRREDQHVEWLAFVCCLGREAEQNNLEIFLIKELVKHAFEFVLLMCVMAI